MQKELSHLKMTILLIRDWDGFQKAMREALLPGSCQRLSGQEVCG